MIYNIVIWMFIFLGCLKSEKLIINYDNSYIEYKGFHMFHNWSAKTSSFDSNIHCKDYKVLNDSTVNNCSIDINAKVEFFNSKNENRDSNMFDAIEGYLYPDVSFKSVTLTNQAPSKANMKGILSFHGVKKEININIDFDLIDNKLLSSAKFFINLEDYNIIPPSLLLIPIENKIEIQVYLEGEFK